MDWNRLAQNQGQCLSPMNTVMRLQSPKEGEQFLDHIKDCHLTQARGYIPATGCGGMRKDFLKCFPLKVSLLTY
jgi:hypothetical protein